MFAHGETATRLRAAAVTDPYSTETITLDWDQVTETDLPAAAFDPGGSLEPTEVGRTSVVTQPTLYVSGEPDVTAQDRVRVRGHIFQVDGAPASWRSPFTGWRPGTAIKLKEVDG